VLDVTKVILLVEDNPDDEALTLRAFAKNNISNSLIVVRDGAEALDYLFRREGHKYRPGGNPALLLLDLKMPKVNGLEVLRQIKRDPLLQMIPVVMLTSSREEGDLLASYELGVNAYVVKPVEFSDFMTAVRRLGGFWAVVNEAPPALAGR
jgi:CheY-like chemotaxis protein